MLNYNKTTMNVPILELPCGSQPTVPTYFVWNWRLKGCSVPASAVKGRLHGAFSTISARRLCHADEAITRPKQMFMAAPVRVI